MNTFRILFYCKLTTHPDEFVNDNHVCVAEATVTKSIYNASEVFRIKLTDLGLHSKFGEFDITKNKERWETIDLDGTELNNLKLSIIESIDAI